LCALGAGAQERPFLFSATPAGVGAASWNVYYDMGYGERTLAPIGHDGLEHNVGVQGRLGRRFTLLGRLGVTSTGTSGSSGRAELLLDVIGSRASRVRLDVGAGFIRERGGVNVLVGRVIGTHQGERWRADLNLVLEKPLADGRDAADLITSLGWARRVGARGLFVGLEAVGEDLEGFWEAEEAEGGAKLMAGPSLRLAPDGRRWQLALVGGPVIYATRSGLRSGADRALAGLPERNGYVVRTSFNYLF
jgi:hypothetical protein